jgi:hypothetical protein
MLTSSSCRLCGRDDSWKHALLDCQMSWTVWALADSKLVEHMNVTYELNARRWIFSMIKLVPHVKFVTLGVYLWAICYARRKAIHEGEF